MAKPGATIILVARFSFFCMEIGLAKSFGVLIPELEDQLQTSNAIIGLITSLSLATMYLGSPIAKMFLHRCSRPHILTTLCGMAAGCALIATAFTRNLVLMGILFMIVGLCCSVVNLQALVLLHEYYQEDFPFASCISVLGIPFGAVILPPVTEKLLEHYGLTGTLLVVGALVLNMIPIGLVLKVPRSVVNVNNRQEEKELDALMLKTPPPEAEEYVRLPSVPNETGDGYRDVDHVDDTQRQCHSTTTNRNMQTREYDSVVQSVGPESSSQAYTTSNVDSHILQYPQCAKDTTCIKDNARHLSRNSESSTEDIDAVEGSMLSSCLSFFYFDVLIKEPLFSVLFLPSVMLTFLVTGGWVLFIVLYAVEHGIDIARGTYLATSGAVGGIVSSILMSVGLRYRPSWSPQYLLWNQALPTVVFFLQILHSSYIYLVVMSFLIGFGLFGFNVTVEAVLSEVVQTKNFPDASSVFYMCVGLGYIVSGYIAGFVQDQTGNIELLFVFLGVTSMVAFLFTLVMILLIRRKQHVHSLQSKHFEDQTTDRDETSLTRHV